MLEWNACYFSGVINKGIFTENPEEISALTSAEISGEISGWIYGSKNARIPREITAGFLRLIPEGISGIP